MRTLHVVTAIGMLAVTAVAAHAEAPAPQWTPAPAGTFVGGSSPHDPRPRGGYVVVGEPLPPPDDTSAHAAVIFYVNKNGGTYVPGHNDARTNRSTIVSQTRTVPAWTVSAAGWQQVMTCMNTMVQRWNVTITDVDPGNVPHYELVTAGRPQDIGMQQGVGGVSPFSCGTINNSIVFTFAEVYGTDYRSVCETNAQEIAHSFGLDHERLCQDPMTYLSGCGQKTFQNTAAACGEYSNRACQCGGSTQNSVALLDQRIGLRPAGGIDAGPGPSIDAGPSMGPDAGQPPQADGGNQPPGSDAARSPSDPDSGLGQDEITTGCGCAGGASGGAPPHVLLLAMAIIVGVGRRRRRSLAQPRPARVS